MRTVTLSCLVLVIAASAALAAPSVPLSKVVMFSSGVGYFERTGEVEKTATVEMSFKTEQINDLLKSLVLQDLGGGTIGPVIYAPQEPLTRTLKSYSVDLSQERSLADMLRSLRGAKVEITGDEVLVGSVIGVEEQQKTAEKGTLTFEVVNLLTDKGIVQVPIWHIKAIKFLDEKLSGDLQRALGALSASHDSGKRPLTLTFFGEGKREVRIGYLLETPVWKTSYRLVADPKGTLLQGWAIVENTTDDDWTNVRLSLVSGRPVSFIQDLYTPLYVQRPSVAPSVIGSPPPQVYEGAMEAAKPTMTPPAPPSPAAAPAMLGAPGSGGGFGGGGGGARRAESKTEVNYDAIAHSGVTAMAAGEKVGELFQYEIAQPVTIARQKSAMIPILSKDITAMKVSVYNQGVNAKFPMNGLKLKNTSGLHLMGGPITVFDGGAYAGDALTTDIAPDDERLITYAVDLGVEVNPEAGDGTEQITGMKITKGVLQLSRKERSEMTYTAKNVAAEKKTLLIEHPIREGWNLVAPAKADEKTRDVYRFKVEVAPKSTAKLTVTEEHPLYQEVALADTDLDLDQIGLYIREPKISPALKQALSKLIDMRTGLADLAQQEKDKAARLKEITDEQDRIRKNMAQLDRQEALYKQYVQKLTAQETEFEKLQLEINALKLQEKKQREELAAYIEGLNIE